jgi:predicted  nucleic acid-binding Zn-ribbon protein
MPHQCTTCERVFPDGSKEMLSGCPDCGGNKFQFKPDSSTPTPTLGDDDTSDSSAPASTTPSDDPPTPDHESPSDDPPTPDPSPAPDATQSATDPRVDADADYIEAESDPSVLDEDTAQADARRDVVTRDELDAAASSPPPSADDAAGAIPPDADEAADSPGLEDLRAELNDQFESIKIVEPGQYELNLMELYDRQECIISLQEDGHYVIEVVDTWRDGER